MAKKILPSLPFRKPCAYTQEKLPLSVMKDWGLLNPKGEHELFSIEEENHVLKSIDDFLNDGFFFTEPPKEIFDLSGYDADGNSTAKPKVRNELLFNKELAVRIDVDGVKYIIKYETSSVYDDVLADFISGSKKRKGVKKFVDAFVYKEGYLLPCKSAFMCLLDDGYVSTSIVHWVEDAKEYFDGGEAHVVDASELDYAWAHRLYITYIRTLSITNKSDSAYKAYIDNPKKAKVMFETPGVKVVGPYTDKNHRIVAYLRGENATPYDRKMLEFFKNGVVEMPLPYDGSSRITYWGEPASREARLKRADAN